MKKRYIVTAWILAAALAVQANAECTQALEKVSVGECIEERVQASIAEKILRLHILANSDCEEDQQVKQKVRDAVGRALEPLLEKAATRTESERIVGGRLDEIADTARQILRENGFSYGAHAQLATAQFPEKTYGSFTFPAGEYRALEIVLGEGEGHNWWCVLYPNMCFRGSVYQVSDGKALKEVLTLEEYAHVFGTKDYRIRLKFLEFLKGTGYDDRRG